MSGRRSKKSRKVAPENTGDSADMATGMTQLLSAITTMPAVASLLKELKAEVALLRREVAVLKNRESYNHEAFLDAAGARKYFARMSKGAFDKYRSVPNAIPGYKLDGKVYYKPEELDRWMKLYNVD